jgi:hypothetical protein
MPDDGQSPKTQYFQLIPVHMRTKFFFQTHFNIVFSRLSRSCGSRPTGTPIQILYAFLGQVIAKLNSLEMNYRMKVLQRQMRGGEGGAHGHMIDLKRPKENRLNTVEGEALRMKKQY